MFKTQEYNIYTCIYIHLCTYVYIYIRIYIYVYIYSLNPWESKHKPMGHKIILLQEPFGKSKLKTTQENCDNMYISNNIKLTIPT